MRLGSILLVGLWMGSVVLFLAAHDYPEQVEAGVTAFNAKVHEAVGYRMLPPKAVQYELGSGIAMVVLPFLLLLVAYRATDEAVRLKKELGENRADVESAKLILSTMQRTQVAINADLSYQLAFKTPLMRE